jgi:alpha-beta hydrolase superfamily lysophospholipase
MTDTYTWKAPDGATLFARAWRPETSPRAHVAVVHGYAEHSGRYAAFASELRARGFEVHAFDWHGHGRSPGVPGDIEGSDRLVEDVAAFFGRLPGPKFLIGHSAGGAAAVLAAGRLPDLAGLVLSSPYLVNATPVSELVVAVGTWLARLFPLVPVKALDQDALSRDPQEVQAYREDPLVYTGRVRARTGTVLLRMGSDALSRAAEIDAPTLVVHGAADRIADPEGSRRLFERLASADKRLEIYPKGFHELLHDLEADRVTRHIVGWLEDRA